MYRLYGRVDNQLSLPFSSAYDPLSISYDIDPLHHYPLPTLPASSFWHQKVSITETKSEGDFTQCHNE